MALLGPALGAQIANAITSPDATPEARALILANWTNIANIICTYIQTNADVIVPPETLIAPSQVNLVASAPGAPVVGAVILPPKVLKVT